MYPGKSVAPERGFDFAISLNLDEIKPEDKEKTLQNVASMRRHILGAPILKALQGIKDGNGGEERSCLCFLRRRLCRCLFLRPSAHHAKRRHSSVSTVPVSSQARSSLW